jgi:hypothetical protein
MNAAVGCIDSGYVCVARSACEEQQSHTCGTVVADMSQSLQYQGVKTAGQAPRPSRRGESRRGLCCEDLVVLMRAGRVCLPAVLPWRCSGCSSLLVALPKRLVQEASH